MTRLRQKIVSAVESDEDVPKARIRGLHRVNKLPQSGILPAERDYGKGAECVEGGSVALRSGTVQHSRDRLEFGFGFGPKETDHFGDLELSGTGCSPNRPSRDINPFNKKTLQNSSELALFRRSPTASSGSVQVRETELHATYSVDSPYEVEVRGAQATRETMEVEAREAQATREMKRKLNPFLREEESVREASATRKMLSEGVMPPERTRGLALPKSLTLDQFVAIMMPHSGILQNPKFHKNDIHSTNTSPNSDSDKPHTTLRERLTPTVCTYMYFSPFDGREMPDKSGEDLFLRADSPLSKGESTYRFDCNTVGPVPVASGYDPRTLTQSAAHVLISSKENIPSLQGEARLPKVSGIPVVEPRDRGTNVTSFTGSNLQSVKDGVLKRQKAFNSMPKTSCFTLGNIFDCILGNLYGDYRDRDCVLGDSTVAVDSA